MLSSALPRGPDAENTKEVQTIIELPYSSKVVNLLLHEVYDNRVKDVTRSETLSDLSSTIRALGEYGIPFETSLSESSMLFGVLSSHCQQSALDVYALAASHAPYLHPLAMHASSFLLSLEFSQISEQIAVTIGSVYLLQLYKLLSERTR